MRVAAIYDVHGNLPALEAVLREVRQANVDLVVVGGDVVPGPMPKEALTCLLDLDIPARFIQGNGERDVLSQIAGREISHIPEQVHEVMQWTGEQLDVEHQRQVASWPATIQIRIGEVGDVLFCHATPRNDTEIFSRLTSPDRLVPVFARVNAPLVVCGHTHMQFDRMIGAVRVVNAGSVGMPFGDAGAYWLLLGPHVELRRTTYDLEEAAERIRGTTYPQAQAFAAQNVLDPPSEAEMLERFAGAELQ